MRDELAQSWPATCTPGPQGWTDPVGRAGSAVGGRAVGAEEVGEWIDRSQTRIRADVAHRKLLAMGYAAMARSSEGEKTALFCLDQLVDRTIVAALVDRLLPHAHAHVLVIDGDRARLAGARAGQGRTPPGRTRQLSSGESPDDR